TENVVGTFDELRTFADELVAAARQRVVYRARNGEDLAALLGGQPGRDQRPAAARRLDHQRAQARAADQAVARGKMPAPGRHAEREFRGHHAGGGDTLGERRVGGRVDRVEPVTQPGDRGAASRQRAFVRRAVDAL